MIKEITFHFIGSVIKAIPVTKGGRDAVEQNTLREDQPIRAIAIIPAITTRRYNFYWMGKIRGRGSCNDS